MPYRGANKQELLLLYMFIVAIHMGNISLVASTMLLISRSKRRIYRYIFLNKDLDAQAPEGLAQGVLAERALRVLDDLACRGAAEHAERVCYPS
jgi:hypothetical protein